MNVNIEPPDPRLTGCQTIPRNVLRQMKGIVDSNSRDENIIKGCQELRTRLKNWTDENQFKLISKRQRLRNNDPSVFNFLAELGKLWSKKWWIIISAYWVAAWLPVPAGLPTVSLEDCGDGGVDIERKLHCAPVINFRQIVMEGREGEAVLWLVTFFILCHLAPHLSSDINELYSHRHYVKPWDWWQGGCWHGRVLLLLLLSPR